MDLHIFTLACHSSDPANLAPLTPLCSTTTAPVRSTTRRAAEARTCRTSLRRMRRSCILRCSWRKAVGAASTHTTRSRYSTGYTHRRTRAPARTHGRTHTCTCKHLRTRVHTHRTRMATTTFTSECSISRARTHASRSRFRLGHAPGRFRSGVMTSGGVWASSGPSVSISARGH